MRVTILLKGEFKVLVTRKKLYVLGLGLMAVSCSKSSSDKAADTTTTTDTSTVASDVTSLKDLSLSGTLKISLPDSIKGSGTAAGLRLEASKSFEACKVREEIREGLSNIAQLASMVCFMENDPTIQFGKKYNIDFSKLGGGGEMPSGGGEMPPGGGEIPGGGEMPPGGGAPPAGGAPALPGLRLANTMPESMQIWIDNATAGKLTVYMCQDKKLSQMIEITGAKKGQSKGMAIMKQKIGVTGFEMNFHRNMSFDNNLTTEGKTVVSIKELIETSSEQFGSEKARRLLALSLSDTDFSDVISGFSGSMQGSENKFSSIGTFNKSFGSVIMKGSFKPAEGEAIEFSNESFFDGQSNNLDPVAYPTEFGESGTVRLSKDKVPGFLDDNFKPEDFPAGAWDCSGTEDLVLDASAAPTDGENSCDAEWNELSEENCLAGSFAKGQAVEVEVDATFDPSVDVESSVSSGVRPPAPPAQ